MNYRKVFLGVLFAIIFVFCFHNASAQPGTSSESYKYVSRYQNVNLPWDVSVDTFGRLYIAQPFLNSPIQVYDPATGKWTTIKVFDGVLGQNSSPYGVAFNPKDKLIYVVEKNNNRLRVYSLDGTHVADVCAIASGWTCASGTDAGQFNHPLDVAIDSNGSVYVADTDNNRIQKGQGDILEQSFVWKTFTQGSPDSPDSKGTFKSPGAVAVDSQGNIYVADSGNNQIQKFDKDGVFLTKWGKTGDGQGQFSSPGGIAVDNAGNVYVSDSGNHRIQKFNPDGQFITMWGKWGKDDPAYGDDVFRFPHGIAVDYHGRVYIADTDNNRIEIFKSSSSIERARPGPRIEQRQYGTPSPPQPKPQSQSRPQSQPRTR